MNIQLSPQKLRRIIPGQTIYRKCPCCDKNGCEYWNGEGNDASPFPKEV